MTYTYEYPRPAVTTDAILVAKSDEGLKVLLIERKHDPFQGFWAFPGGFVDMDEELEAACKRELMEETGIAVDHLTQFSTFGKVDRDPRGRTISVVFYATIEKEIIPVANDDAANAQWINLQQLPQLAFDHQEIIEKFSSEILPNL